MNDIFRRAWKFLLDLPIFENFLQQLSDLECFEHARGCTYTPR